jgi:hypothetical protein
MPFVFCIFAEYNDSAYETSAEVVGCCPTDTHTAFHHIDGFALFPTRTELGGKAGCSIRFA